MTRRMTRTLIVTIPLHNQHSHVQKLMKKGAKTSYLTRTLTRSLTHTFDSSPLAEMSVLTRSSGQINKMYFVHISPAFPTLQNVTQKLVRRLIENACMAHWLRYESITFKSPIL